MVYINGAIAVPCVKTIIPDNKTNKINKGISQYFPLLITNPINSLIKFINIVY
tara:strand:- start:1300 stop:1458 length:159 start_codon:yes stop_codon:yes gene_type:complete